MSSLLGSLTSLDEEQATQAIQGMSEAAATEILHDWAIWRRPNQDSARFFDDATKVIWFIMTGRGWGKTRTGGEAIQEGVKRGYKRIALVGRTAPDARDVMIEGESGILALAHPADRPVYQPSVRRLRWPNGAQGTTYTGEKPQQLRGPQHELAWIDELAAMPRAQETLDNLMLGLRLGQFPKAIITSTPKPIKPIRDLLDRDDVLVTTGSTYANLDNLAPAFASIILKKYEGTRTGLQEIEGRLLEEAEGALWQRSLIDRARLSELPKGINIIRAVVAIDPAVTSNTNSDETGIVGALVDDRNPPHGYIVGDASGRYSPRTWASHANSLRIGIRADRIIGEANNGGDLVEYTLRTVYPNVSYKAVRASRGKRARAEPIVAMYEQSRIHHIGIFPEMEDQMCTWEPLGIPDSPDRLDAAVWALTELMLGAEWSIV